MTKKNWFSANKAAIAKRLDWLRNKPEGVIYNKSSEFHDILINKSGSHIHLVFSDPTAQEIISRMDVNDPLYLLAPYTQAMMLGLLWKSNPKRTYILGFGGGRIPMILHHYYPDTLVESTEIDMSVVDISKRFFGVELDSRLQVKIRDGRDFLCRLKSNTQYDIIMIDAFRGIGYGPYHLATKEFFDTCKTFLVKDGILVMNLLPGDSLYFEKIRTLMSSLENVYFISVDGTDILFGSNNIELNQAKLVEQANLIQETYHFSFPFVDHANNLQPISEVGKYSSQIENAQILTDSSPPAGYFDSLSGESTIFKKVGRNAPCPCGSGKKFKKCHGK
jgi:spermidine synthase